MQNLEKIAFQHTPDVDTKINEIRDELKDFTKKYDEKANKDNTLIENILKNHLRTIIPRDDLSIIDSVKTVKIYG